MKITEKQVNEAVKLLCNYFGNQLNFVLAADSGVYLIPMIQSTRSTEVKKHIGEVQYQISNDLPGERSESLDTYSPKEAIKIFKEYVNDFGTPAGV